MSATAVANRPTGTATRPAVGDVAPHQGDWARLLASPSPDRTDPDRTDPDRTDPAPQGGAPEVRRRTSSRARPLRPGLPARRRRSGRGVSPVAKAAGLRPSGSLTPVPALSARGCVVDVATAPEPAVTRAHTRLTDRGIAVILVAGVMLVVAAVTVVGLTAFRVTGESAEPLPLAPVGQPFSAQP